MNQDAVVFFVMGLVHRLREQGVTVGTQQVLHCQTAVAGTISLSPRDLYTICKTTLINRMEDLEILDRVFIHLLQNQGVDEKMTKVTLDERVESEGWGEDLVREWIGTELEIGQSPQVGYRKSYSRQSVDTKADFHSLTDDERAEVMKYMSKVARRYAVIMRNRWQGGAGKGPLDVPKMLRKSISTCGEPILPSYRKKRNTHVRFVVLADVSGSMELYSSYVLSFFYFMSRHRKIRTDVFVFSTRLHRLPSPVLFRDVQSFLDHASDTFNGWSGGTKIGWAIHELNHRFAFTQSRKATVLIVSDGWDTGNIDMLAREMSLLKQRVHQIIWLNPLKGDPHYEPLASGMKAAYPFCDHFLSSHNLASLSQLARLLAGQ